MKNISVKEKQVLTLIPEQEQEKIKRKFAYRVVRDNVVACSTDIRDKNADLDKLQTESEEGLIALHASGGLQQMLAAQMLSIHQLQQTSMCMANNHRYGEAKKYFTNTAIKLSNAFVQQANLLTKLQGHDTQKIIVERVEVNHGGQAIVGNVQGTN